MAFLLYLNIIFVTFLHTYFFLFLKQRELLKSFLQPNELNKTFDRFNKIRLYHNYGFMNILPVKQLLNNSHKYRQIQLNTDTHFNAIIMDIDDEEMLTEWNSVGLPTPSIQTLNQNNNRAHLVWLLNVPVSKRNKKAVNYYKAIVNSIKILIGADQAYQNHQTKNFLNTQMYRVTYNDLAYDLDDFSNFIVRDTKIDIAKHNEDLQKYESTGSRHIDLFNQLRLYGYQIATQRNLKEKLQQRAELINEQFDSPIKPKSIVKSVYNFCEEHKHNFRNSRSQKRGPMGFKKIKGLSKDEFSLELHKRQNKSASRTASIKRHKTSVGIKVAIDKLVRLKQKVTYKNISKISNISLRTAKNYVKLVKFFTKRINGAISSIRVIVLRVEERNTNPLKYLEKSNAVYINYYPT